MSGFEALQKLVKQLDFAASVDGLGAMIELSTLVVEKLQTLSRVLVE
jgi:hypothetical protein